MRISVIRSLVSFLMYSALIAPSYCYASDEQVSVGPSRPQLTQLEVEENNAQQDKLRDYIKKKAVKLFDWLPTASINDIGDDASFLAPLAAPVILMTKLPDEKMREAVWLTPGYQHNHGLLPFDDALMIGPSYKKKMLDDDLKFKLHPFYAQNWTGSNNYWGVETSLGIGEKGNIALRFANGNEDLMNHSRGFELQTNYNFNKSLALQAGVDYQDNASVMLRWRLVDLSK